MKTNTLADLVGLRMLDAVDIRKESVKRYDWSDAEDVEVCRFRLDGTIYQITDDPSDGYRSSADFAATRLRKIANAFEPVQVFCYYQERGDYSGKDDVLKIMEAQTGKVILMVGTSNIDDYYPSYVCSYSPENLPQNTPRVA